MTTMSMEEFVKHCRTCQGPAWFRLDVNVPSRITIPRSRAEQALLGVHRAVFFRKNGKKNGDLRKFILTEETHKLLLKHDAMPLGPKERPVRPQTRALLNVFDLGDDELKVWDMPGSVAFRLNDIHEDPDIPGIFDVILAITKKSTGTRTIEVYRF